VTGRPVALVTGGGRGIGRAISIQLARDGFEIALTWTRNEIAARQTVEAIEAAGASAVAYRADIGDADDVVALSARVVSDHGRLDALINNCGIVSRGRTVVATEMAELHRVLAVDVIGAFQLCQLLIPTLRRSPQPSIVMISSITASYPIPGSAPYIMAKRALEALATVLSIEESKHGVRVNVVSPGLTATDMGNRMVKSLVGIADATHLDGDAPFGRVTRPDDIAGMVSFFCSPAGHQITGQRVEIHGGRFRYDV
jgi:3-oxoacyl-[acyl-carrier protein] reductase